MVGGNKEGTRLTRLHPAYAPEFYSCCYREKCVSGPSRKPSWNGVLPGKFGASVGSWSRCSFTNSDRQVPAYLSAVSVIHHPTLGCVNSKRHANGDAPRTSCARRLGCPSVRNGQRSSEDRGQSTAWLFSFRPPRKPLVLFTRVLPLRSVIAPPHESCDRWHPGRVPVKGHQHHR